MLDAGLAAEFAAMGVAFDLMPAAAVADADADIAEEAFEVLSINWPSVCAFLGCETQWRALATMAGLIWLGIDYAAADVVLRRTAAPDDVFADLQLMERAALAVFREHPA